VHTVFGIVQGKRATFATIHELARKLGVHLGEITEFAIKNEVE